MNFLFYILLFFSVNLFSHEKFSCHYLYKYCDVSNPTGVNDLQGTHFECFKGSSSRELISNNQLITIDNSGIIYKTKKIKLNRVWSNQLFGYIHRNFLFIYDLYEGGQCDEALGELLIVDLSKSKVIFMEDDHYLNFGYIHLVENDLRYYFPYDPSKLSHKYLSVTKSSVIFKEIEENDNFFQLIKSGKKSNAMRKFSSFSSVTKKDTDNRYIPASISIDKINCPALIKVIKFKNIY